MGEARIGSGQRVREREDEGGQATGDHRAGHWPLLNQFFPPQFNSIANSIQVRRSDAPGAGAEETMTPVLIFLKK